MSQLKPEQTGSGDQSKPGDQVSLSYLELITDERRVKELVEGSYMSADDPLQAWERGRKFTADALHRDGTILDIGRANGFLLKSLEEWSPHKQISYGIDSGEHNIQNARELHPDMPNHFKQMRLEEFLTQVPQDSPEKFDCIYWAVWTNHEVTRDEIEMLLSRVVDGGRLLLGFYPDSDQDPSEIKGNIDKLKEFGYEVTIFENKNYPGRNEKVVAIDKPVKAHDYDCSGFLRH